MLLITSPFHTRLQLFKFVMPYLPRCIRGVFLWFCVRMCRVNTYLVGWSACVCACVDEAVVCVCVSQSWHMGGENLNCSPLTFLLLVPSRFLCWSSHCDALSWHPRAVHRMVFGVLCVWYVTCVYNRVMCRLR